MNTEITTSLCSSLLSVIKDMYRKHPYSCVLTRPFVIGDGIGKQREV